MALLAGNGGVHAVAVTMFMLLSEEHRAIVTKHGNLRTCRNASGH